MGVPMLILRLTVGEFHDLLEGLDVCEDERFDSYRTRLKRGCGFEEALSLRDSVRVRRPFRTIGKRAVREAEG